MLADLSLNFRLSYLRACLYFRLYFMKKVNQVMPLLIVLFLSWPSDACEFVQKIKGTIVTCQGDIEGRFGELELTRDEWQERANHYCEDNCSISPDAEEAYKKSKQQHPTKYRDISLAQFVQRNPTYRLCGVKNISLGSVVNTYEAERIFICYDESVQNQESNCSNRCTLGPDAEEAYKISKQQHPAKYRGISLAQFVQQNPTYRLCGVKSQSCRSTTRLVTSQPTIKTEKSPPSDQTMGTR